MSTVTPHVQNIETFFERRALRGATLPGTGGSSDRLADRMVRKARANARTMFNQRTGDLADSVVKIVRANARTGALEVGVGTTLKYGEYLEEGTRPHTIARAAPTYVLKSGGPKDRPPFYQNPRRLYGAKRVRHPGNRPYGWLRKARDDVLAGG